ncbi:MAG: hypothetical protein RLZZ511_195 [Cyanobacteriota bacterium]|jgi:uncharacterized membrane protein YkvA (DUF1232 family)
MANNTFSLESIYNWYRNLVSNPKYRWWVIAGTLVYLLSPIDLIPDIFPFIGQIDDVVVITMLATELTGVLRDRVTASKQKKDAPADTAATTEMVDVNAVEVE